MTFLILLMAIYGTLANQVFNINTLSADSQINETNTGENGTATSDASLREEPDDDCLFNPSLPKCAPIAGKCPLGFLMNEKEQCFPDKPCPPGFAKLDEDETGTCYPVSTTTPPTTNGANLSSSARPTITLSNST